MLGRTNANPWKPLGVRGPLALEGSPPNTATAAVSVKVVCLEMDPEPPLRPLAIVATPVQTDATLLPAAPVTALRACGRNVELHLSTEKASFTFGAGQAPEIDLTLDGDGISRLHAVIQRRGLKLRVLDQRSTNGTYFRGKPDSDFEIGAGDVFVVTKKGIKLIALDEQLRLLRPKLQWAIGLRAHVEVDQALEDVASDAPLLIIGPRHCEQRALANEIHRHSSFRNRDLVASPFIFATPAEYEAKLAHAERGSFYLDLTDADPKDEDQVLSGRFVSLLFAGKTRPIVVARDEQHAQSLLGAAALGMRTLRLPPLNSRREEVAKLLDALLLQYHQAAIAEAQASAVLLPLVALGDANVARLKAYAWANDFEDLRRVMLRLYSVLTNRLKMRASARHYGCSPSAMAEALERLGIDLKLVSDELDVEDDEQAPQDARGAVADGPVTPLDPPAE